MKPTCENCVFSQSIPPPSYEQPPELPKTITRRFLCFSWQEKPHCYDRIANAFARENWQDKMDTHKEKIHCIRYPSKEVKHKTDVCGEFEQKENNNA